MTSLESETQSVLNREVLLHAWARMSVYDQTASRLKLIFVNRRRWVIAMTLSSTVAAVLAAIIGNNVIAVILSLIGIILPTISSYLMNDVVKFTGTTSWIKYRYMAEMMRMHIYLYRMQAGEYANGPVDEKDDLLADNLNAVREKVQWDEVIPPMVSEPHGEEAIIAVIKDANGNGPDDGLSELSVEDYCKWRIDGQRQWYEKNIQGDFDRMKRFVRFAQIFLLLGALASFLGGLGNVQIVLIIAITEVGL